MRINILEGRAEYVVLMGHVSVIILYSSWKSYINMIKTYIKTYINENSFIENLAASK